MKATLTIAKNTLKQTIRDKILYGIIIFALLFLGSTVVLGSLSLGENVFVIRNFGLAGIYIFGLVITIFLGASVVYDEVEKKTTYILLAKPATRKDIIVGKFIGLWSGIGITTLLMTGVYSVIVYANGGGIDHMAFLAVGLQLLEMGLLVAILILFSIFTTPLAATIYTILIIYIGHLLNLILEYAIKSGGMIKTIMIALYYLLPNLEKFNIRNLIVHDISVTPNEIVVSISYAAIYIFLLIYLSKIVLDRKNL